MLNFLIYIILLEESLLVLFCADLKKKDLKSYNLAIINLKFELLCTELSFFLVIQKQK